MGRKKIEINTKRGERLKQLLSDGGMGQNELAAIIGYTKEHISYIINGRRNLTEEAAQAIIKQFSGTRIEWLMGYDDYKTEGDRIDAITFGSNEVYDLIKKLMELHGYVVVADTFDYEPPEADENGKQYREVYYGIKSIETGACAYIGNNEIERLIYEIDDFIEFKCLSAVNIIRDRMERKNRVARNRKEVDRNG